MVVKAGSAGNLKNGSFQTNATGITEIYQLGLGTKFDAVVQNVPNYSVAKNDPIFSTDEPSKVDLSEMTVLEQQQILSDAGFYVTDRNHPYYQDGIAGPVTDHAIALYENPEAYAQSHIATMMNNSELSSAEVMMLQGDLKALGFSSVGVSGQMDAQTLSAVEAYVDSNPDIETARFLENDGQLKTAFTQTEPTSIFGRDWNVATLPDNVRDMAYEIGIEILELREGYSNKIYLDSEGYPTVGIGTLITEGHPLHGKPVGYEISHEEVIEYFYEEYDDVFDAALEQAVEMGVANDPNSIAQLAQMNYQLGTAWTQVFHNTWPAMVRGDYDLAIEGIEGSKWASQTPVRTADAVDWLKNLQENQAPNALYASNEATSPTLG